MYISFDYSCTSCPKVEQRLVKKDSKDNQMCQCQSPMKRLPAGTRTTFRFADTNLKK